MLTTFLMMIGLSFAFPSVYAIPLSATDMPGVAGTLINTVVLLGVSAITAVISRLHVHSGATYAFLFMVMAGLASIFYVISIRFMPKEH